MSLLGIVTTLTMPLQSAKLFSKNLKWIGYFENKSGSKTTLS